MTTGTLNEFILDRTEIKITSYDTFLGSIITRDGYDTITKKSIEDFQLEEWQ